MNVTEIFGLKNPGYGIGVTVGEIDNDEDVDILISNNGPDALYLNNEDGTFEHVSAVSGIRY